MGIEKDYLMRQLMLLFEVIQRILRHRKKDEDDEAQEEISYFYSILKIEKDIHQMTIEELIKYLQIEKNLTNKHIEMVAFVLKEQGELSTDKNIQLDYFRKSYFLLEKVDLNSTSFSMDRQMKMAELKELIN